MVIICCSMSPISLRVSCPFSVPSRPESPPSDRCWEGWWTELSACIPGWPLMPSPRPLEGPLPVRGCCCNISERRTVATTAARLCCSQAHTANAWAAEEAPGPLAIDRKSYKPCQHNTTQPVIDDAFFFSLLGSWEREREREREREVGVNTVLEVNITTTVKQLQQQPLHHFQKKKAEVCVCVWLCVKQHRLDLPVFKCRLCALSLCHPTVLILVYKRLTAFERLNKLLLKNIPWF